MRLLAFLLMLLAAPLGATTLRGVAVDDNAVVLDLDGAVAAPRGFAMTAPMRLVIDLPGVATRGNRSPGGGPVLQLRAAQFDPATARVVIELAAPMRIASARQRRDGQLVVRLVPVGEAAFARLVARRPAVLADYVSAAVPIDAATLAQFDLPAGVFASDAHPAAPAVAEVPAPPRPAPGKRPLVVIDAGHGGRDVGAIGVTGGHEKDVTLAIARAAAKALRASGRVRVKLTRDRDVFIPLGGRVAIARDANADLFVSIYADSAPNAEARGASVYTLSEIASDALSARLAARENKSDIIAGVNLGVDAPEVSDIMIDLVQRDTMNASVSFAETLQAALQPRVPFRGAFHRFAGFVVLKAPDVPSVLLETGYVTNTGDAARLFSAGGQRAVGEGVAAAIEAYLLK